MPDLCSTEWKQNSLTSGKCSTNGATSYAQHLGQSKGQVIPRAQTQVSRGLEVGYSEAWEVGSLATCGSDSNSLSNTHGQYAQRSPTMLQGNTAISWSQVRKQGMQHPPGLHQELSQWGGDFTSLAPNAGTHQLGCCSPAIGVSRQTLPCLGSLGVLLSPADNSPAKHSFTPYLPWPLRPQPLLCTSPSF